jgi:glycosyltransferase involved in cell wall biosynthesis
MNKVADFSQSDRLRRQALRVCLLGFRGFPNVQGGAEKHAENLARALAGLGCEVEAIVRSGYVAKDQSRTWCGVRLSRLWAPRLTGFEAFVHTFLGVLRAAVSRPDILHIHAIGPAFFTPLARLLGLRVVVTYHSLNYQHQKWGRMARAVLRWGEWAGMAFANGRIAVSEGLLKHLQRSFGVPVVSIPNGIDPPLAVRSTAALDAFGLVPEHYVLMVARIDQDKRQLDLIEAYGRLQAPGWKLALVGAADYASVYARTVADAARNSPGVVLLGHQNGTALAELYSHAGGFVLPSRFEGQPIAVLEAASYGLPVALSDIAAHRELALPHAHYFAVGDCAALAACLADIIAAPTAAKPSPAERAALIARHDWHNIAQRTLGVYFDALSGTSTRRPVAASRPAKTRELS